MDFLKSRFLKYICLSGVVCLLTVNLAACGCSRVEDSEVASIPSAEQSEIPRQEVTAASVQKATAEPMQKPTATPAQTPTAEPVITPTPISTSTPPPTVTPGSTLASCPILSVEGTKLVDESGNPVQLRGVSTHGLAWYPGYVNEECFKQLKEEWGANVVRLAMYTAEYSGYCSGGDKEALKKLVKDGVEYATDLGLYVIIDWHILSDGNPNTYVEEAKVFFSEMAETYADYTNVLYEICNEPNGGTTWNQVKEYAEALIPVIREKDEDGIILVGTPNWCQYVDQAAADPISGYENIMYTLHFYAATHTDGLRNNMVAALESGLPLFVSEYGICDASGSGNIDEYQANQWVKLMDEYQISYVAWNLSNKGETSAFFKSECSKTNGFTQDDLSASGKWVYEMLRERAGNITAGAPVTTAVPVVPMESTASPTTVPVASGESAGAFAVTSGNIEVPEISAPAGLICAATVVNSWEQDGSTCAQYVLTITNGTDALVETWSVSLPFEQEIAVMSSWNGNFQAEENLLTITPADYNSCIQEGGSISDIGFILQITQK